jgi:hypothetical protein
MTISMLGIDIAKNAFLLHIAVLADLLLTRHPRYFDNPMMDPDH